MKRLGQSLQQATSTDHQLNWSSCEAIIFDQFRSKRLSFHEERQANCILASLEKEERNGFWGAGNRTQVLRLADHRFTQ